MKKLATKLKFDRYFYFALFFIVGFIGLNSVLFIYDIFWLLTLPFSLILIYLALYKPSFLLLIIAFLTPLSIVIEVQALQSTFQFPNEPLILGLMLLLFFKLMLDGNYDMRIIRHPLTVIILINLLWILITSLTSTMPVVSIKFFISRLWFVTVFYFLAAEFFRNFDYVKSYFIAFGASLMFVIFFTLFKHAEFGFEQNVTNLMTKPFFNDHTVYSATISLVLPITAALLFYGKHFNIGLYTRMFLLLLLVVFITGIIFSYSRASWIGLMVASLLFIVMMLRIRFRTIMTTMVLSFSLIFIFRVELIEILEKNQDVSGTDYSQHVRSMYNISTDVSNTERINRWLAAYRMFLEKPLFGWGPGTYMFQYAPFQHSSQMTIISTNFAEGGNAHSEYMGPLSESGLLGMLTFMAIVLISIQVGMNVFYRSGDIRIRVLAISAVLGLVTYFTHGMLNNFLDTDKASVPFWALLALLTILDLKYRGAFKELGKKNSESISS